MTETQITVSYERKLSDGNYGSEGFSMSLTVDIDAESFAQAEEEGVLLVDVLHDRAVQLRAAVLSELALSEADRVAWAAKRELQAAPAQPPSQPRQTAPSQDLEDIPF